jgi:hypothetical protein
MPHFNNKINQILLQTQQDLVFNVLLTVHHIILVV